MPGKELFTVILSITTNWGLKPERINTDVAADRLLIVNGNAPCEPAARDPAGNHIWLPLDGGVGVPPVIVMTPSVLDTNGYMTLNPFEGISSHKAEFVAGNSIWSTEPVAFAAKFTSRYPWVEVWVIP